MPRINQVFVPPRDDRSGYTRRMSDLIRMAGENEADLALRQGDISANLGANIAGIAGQLGGSLVEGVAQNRAQQSALAHRNQIQDVKRLTPPDAKGRPDFARIVEELSLVDVDEAAKYLRFAEPQIQEQVRAEKDKADHLSRLFTEFDATTKKLDPKARQVAYTALRSQAIDAGVISAEDAPEKLNPSFLAKARSAIESTADFLKRISPPPVEQKTREVKTRNADGSETISIVPADELGTFTSAAEAPKSPTLGSFEDFVAREYGKTATPEQILKARKAYQQSDDRPITVNANAPKTISPTMEANIINRLTTQWGKISEPARDLQRQVGIMDAGLNAAQRGDINAGSQAVITTFNKILDALSVVRESEYLRTAAGQSVVNRIKGAIEKLTSGGAGIPLPELVKFATLAREMATEQQKYLPAAQERIGKTADRYQIPRELIFDAPTAPSAAPPQGGSMQQPIPGVPGGLAESTDGGKTWKRVK